MEDAQLISLYFARDEAALTQTEAQYGAYCRRIAMNILENTQDAEECVSDTWLQAWYAIPPQRPMRLGLFLGKITRNLSFDRYRASRAAKRGGGALDAVLEELATCIPGGEGPEERIEARELARSINGFLRQCGQTQRRCFLLRYYYGQPVREIARSQGLTENRVSVLLYRTRKKLRSKLEQEGYVP